nr:aldehyde dehydrogenase family protein [Candidatus Sigynarchaeota archaeon]
MVIVSTNPATLETNGEVAENSIEEVKDAFERARAAQREWRAINACTRARIVVGVNEYLSNHMDDISMMISKEVGKTPLEAFITEVYGAMDGAFYYYSVAPEILERKANLDLRFYSGLNKTSYILHKPAGVISVIGPYNYPFAIPFGQIVQSLMAGN